MLAPPDKNVKVGEAGRCKLARLTDFCVFVGGARLILLIFDSAKSAMSNIGWRGGEEWGEEALSIGACLFCHAYLFIFFLIFNTSRKHALAKEHAMQMSF